MLAEESDFAGLQPRLRVAANDFTQKEQSPYVEWLCDAMWVSRAIPHGGELVGAHLQAGFFPDFSGYGLGGAFVHVRPSTRQRPAVPILHLTNEQYLAVLKDGTTDAKLRGGVASLPSEHHLNVRRCHAGVFGHNQGGQRLEPLIALAIVLILCEGKAGLGQRLYLARPDQPSRLGEISWFAHRRPYSTISRRQAASISCRAKTTIGKDNPCPAASSLAQYLG